MTIAPSAPHASFERKNSDVNSPPRLLVSAVAGLLILTVVASFAFLGSFPYSASAESTSFPKIARKWVHDRNNRNSEAVKGFFKEIETKNAETLRGFDIELKSLGLSGAAEYRIPESTDPLHSLTNLAEFRIDNRSIIVARYERKDKDEPLQFNLAFFLKDGNTCKPMVFPYEVGSLEIARPSPRTPVLLNVIEGGHGSGTIAHIYKLKTDGTLKELMNLGMWQASVVMFMDLDHSGQPEIFHATYSYFPNDLNKLLGKKADPIEDRFYKAEIYRWEASKKGTKANKFARIGTKYYLQFPPFFEMDVKKGWEKCYALSNAWIAKDDEAMSEPFKTYFHDIESWTRPPASAAVMGGVDVAIEDGIKMGIPETETYQRWGGDVPAKLDLVNLRRFDVEGKEVLLATYEDVKKVRHCLLYVSEGGRLTKLTIDPRHRGFEDSIRLIRLGNNTLVLVDVDSSDVFGHASFYAFSQNLSLNQKLDLDLFYGRYWFADVDGDGDDEIVVFNSVEAPSGIGRLLEENELGNYALYVPRVTIYKWGNEGFVRIAVKYYASDEHLPSGLIMEALTKMEASIKGHREE
jgi:hypothetical protein